MATITQRGNSFEMKVKRALLGKPFTRTFPTREQAIAYAAQLESLLDKGIVPVEIRFPKQRYAALSDLLKDYRVSVALPESDKDYLNVVDKRIGETSLEKIDYNWIEAWIRRMKSEHNLAPNTIRHQVGALARCFDWAGNKGVVSLIVNPIRKLPKRYAQYSDDDIRAARQWDGTAGVRRDIERTRRLKPGEEERIRSILDGAKPEGRERPLELKYQAALECLFDLAVESAMRLRELYTLSLDQVDLAKRTVYLDKTKNGSSREVPLSSVAVTKLEGYIHHVKQQSRGMDGINFSNSSSLLFPWWNGEQNLRGEPDEDELKRVTQLLSKQFVRIFVAAGCNDLTFHGLRHEATSRLFERTNLSEFEIMKITGHSSSKMLKRYANLRGSKLAERLW